MRSAAFLTRRSLAARLLCTYAVALLLTGGAIVGALWFFSQRDVGLTAQEQLHNIADSVRQGLQLAPAEMLRGGKPPDSEGTRLLRDFSTDLKYRVLDQSGRVITSSDKDAAALLPPDRALDTTGASSTSTSAGEALFVRTEKVRHGTQTYYIQVALSKRFADLVQLLARRIRIADTLLWGAVSLVLVSIAVYFTLRRVLQPVREISAAAAHIDTRNLSARLSTQNLPTEILPVITAFNSTLDRLERGYVIQRTFLADAAHELKTPLALMRAQIDMEGTTDRQVLLQDIDRMARQVNQLLQLAEASESQNYVVESVDLVEVAEDVADFLRPLAERHQVYIDIRCGRGARRIEADQGALFVLLKNLVENAIQHSPPGRGVTMSVDTDHLSVRDEGPGISDDELPKLFKRFWRGTARRREGAGLGLSICAEIAQAHNWKLTAQRVDAGARFSVAFASGPLGETDAEILVDGAPA